MELSEPPRFHVHGGDAGYSGKRVDSPDDRSPDGRVLSVLHYNASGAGLGTCAAVAFEVPLLQAAEAQAPLLAWKTGAIVQTGAHRARLQLIGAGTRKGIILRVTSRGEARALRCATGCACGEHALTHTRTMTDHYREFTRAWHFMF